MSKTIDNLNNIQNDRQNGSGSLTHGLIGKAIDKNRATRPRPEPTVTPSTKPDSSIHTTPDSKQNNKPINPLTIIYAIIIINIMLTIGILLTISSNKSNYNATISKMSATVTQNIRQLNDQISTVNLRIKDMSVKITELEKSKESQQFAIENLNKAKNSLFNKINTLETELEKPQTNKQ